MVRISVRGLDLRRDLRFMKLCGIGASSSLPSATAAAAENLGGGRAFPRSRIVLVSVVDAKGVCVDVFNSSFLAEVNGSGYEGSKVILRKAFFTILLM